MIDVNIIRDPDIALHGLTKADSVYTLYYDETNNIRRLHVRSDGLNAPRPKCFAICGIAHVGPVRELRLDDLRSALGVQRNVTELKLKHVGSGSFLDVLSSPRLEIFLKWLIDQSLFIHYSVLDPFYWSIVDVIDSILTEHSEPSLLFAHMELKSDLYTVLRHDYDGTIDLLRRYTYPDVGREKRPAFVAELRGLLQQRRDLLEPFNAMMLKGILQIAETLHSLPYLEDETANVLIESFGTFYVQRICLFKNSQHILDVEEVIRKHLENIGLTDNGCATTHFRFAVSHDEPGIQVSDIITGLIGKFFSYICAVATAEARAARRDLSPQQTLNLCLMKRLLDRSAAENAAFAHRVLSLGDQERAESFLEQ